MPIEPLKILGAWLLLGVQALWAQNAFPHRPTFWEGPNLVRLCPDSEHAALVESPGGILRKIPRPTRTTSLRWDIYDYLDGFCYARAYGRVDTPKGRSFLNEIHRYEQGRWQKVATFTWSEGDSGRPPLGGIYPLRNGKFLGVSSQPAYLSGGKAYPLAILRKPESSLELEVEYGMDLGFEQPFFKPLPPKGVQRSVGESLNYPYLHFPLFAAEPARTERHLVLGIQAIGYFLVFDAENGHFLRTVKLYPQVDELEIRRGDLLPGILGFQPRPGNQTILIAARREEAVLFAAKAHPLHTDGLNESTWKQHLGRIQDLFSLRESYDPRIEWWDLDPETGRLRKEEPPQGVSERVEDASKFFWRFKVDGNLHVDEGAEYFRGEVPQPCDPPQSPKSLKPGSSNRSAPTPAKPVQAR